MLETQLCHFHVVHACTSHLLGPWSPRVCNKMICLDEFRGRLRSKKADSQKQYGVGKMVTSQESGVRLFGFES